MALCPVPCVQQCTVLQQEASLLQAKLAKSKNANQKLEIILHDLDLQSTEQRQEFEKQLVAANKALRSSGQQLTASQQQLNQAQSELAEVQQQLHAAKPQVVDVQQQEAALKQRLADMEAQIRAQAHNSAAARAEAAATSTAQVGRWQLLPATACRFTARLPGCRAEFWACVSRHSSLLHVVARVCTLGALSIHTDVPCTARQPVLGHHGALPILTAWLRLGDLRRMTHQADESAPAPGSCCTAYI